MFVQNAKIKSGNPILDKNLESIARYNLALKEKLLNLPYLTNDIQLIETSFTEPNLSYNNLPLHSQVGAEFEAKEIFNKTDDTPLFIHFILGIGLGHLFKEFCEQSKGKVILYESNIEILRVTLELVDFSKELSQPNVRIASDYTELKQMFHDLYEYKTNVNFAILDSYRIIYGEKAQKMLDEIGFLHKHFFINYQYYKERSYEHILSLLDNLVNTLEYIPLYELKDIYQGKTALIVSAGPTLDSNIETIKNNRDKFVIFCVGPAFKALADNGIRPDFLNVIEIIDCIGQVDGYDLSDIKLILEPSTNASFHILKTKQKFIYPPNTSPWGKYWAELVDVDVSPYFTSGTVSYEALYSAKMLGFKKIILVGSDLAYINNSCYSESSAYSDLVFEINPETQKPHYKIVNYEGFIKSIVPADKDIADPWCREFAENTIKQMENEWDFVKSINGKMLPTRISYASFVEVFRTFASENKHLELINTSMIGAQIDGFENIPLKEIVKNLKPFNKLELASSFKFNKQKVFEKLNYEELILKRISGEFLKAKEYISKLAKEFEINNKFVIEDSELFKRALIIYKKIYTEYFLKNKLFELISLNENLEVEYMIKANSDMLLWYEALKNYYESVSEKILLVLEKIHKILNDL